jgi:tetratricopeptide (TPR) repeat protein
MSYDPTNGGIYSKLGYIFMQPDYEFHDDAKAWTYMEKSLKLLPDNIFALYNGGVILLKHGSFAQAEKLLVHATELNPLMASAWLRAGEAALFQDKRTEAIIRFRRALALNANQEDAKMYLKKMGVPEQ